MPAKRPKDHVPIDNGEKHVVLHDDDGEPVLRIWAGFLKPESRPTVTFVREDVVIAEEKTTLSAEEKPTTITAEEKPTSTIRGTVTTRYDNPRTQLQSIQSTMLPREPTVTGANSKGYWTCHTLRKSDVPVNATTVIFVPPYDRGEVFPLRFYNKTLLSARAHVHRLGGARAAPSERNVSHAEHTLVTSPRPERHHFEVRKPRPRSRATRRWPQILPCTTGRKSRAGNLRKAGITILNKDKVLDWPFNVAFAKYPRSVVHHHVKPFYAQAEGDPSGKDVWLGGDEENTKDGQDVKPKEKKK